MFAKLQGTVKDRKAWHAAVRGVAEWDVALRRQQSGTSNLSQSDPEVVPRLLSGPGVIRPQGVLDEEIVESFSPNLFFLQKRKLWPAEGNTWLFSKSYMWIQPHSWRLKPGNPHPGPLPFPSFVWRLRSLAVCPDSVTAEQTSGFLCPWV